VLVSRPRPITVGVRARPKARIVSNSYDDGRDREEVDGTFPDARSCLLKSQLVPRLPIAAYGYLMTINVSKKAKSEI
jgi:hypothetical protein